MFCKAILPTLSPAIALCAALLLSTGCRSTNSYYSPHCLAAEDPDIIYQDLRCELVSMQCQQDDARTELNILGERMEEQQLSSQTHLEVLHAQLTGLQRKVDEMEQQQTTALRDIRELGRYAQESAIALTDVQSQQSQFREGYSRDLDTIKGAVQSISAGDASQKQPRDRTTYKVVSGDTLEKIARKYDTTVGAIKEENGLKNDRIFAGQTLIIP